MAALLLGADDTRLGAAGPPGNPAGPREIAVGGACPTLTAGSIRKLPCGRFYGFLPALLLYGVHLGINQIIDLHGRVTIEPWKPLVWELSSVVVVFALIPLIVRFERIIRIDSEPRWRVVVWHLCAAVIFSAIHVAGRLRNHRRPAR